MKREFKGDITLTLVKFFGGPFVKTGQIQTKERILTLYEREGKKALVARRVIYRKGRPVATVTTGWAPV